MSYKINQLVSFITYPLTVAGDTSAGVLICTPAIPTIPNPDITNILGYETHIRNFIKARITYIVGEINECNPDNEVSIRRAAHQHHNEIYGVGVHDPLLNISLELSHHDYQFQYMLTGHTHDNDPIYSMIGFWEDGVSVLDKAVSDYAKSKGVTPKELFRVRPTI